MATSRGYTEYGPTDDANVWTKLNTIVGEISDDLDGASISDTGVMSTGITVTAGSGWSVTYSGEAKNGWLILSLTATRTGSALTISSGGNIAPDVDIATITTAFRPPLAVWGSYVGTGTSGGSYLGTDGVWTITDANTSSAISNGDAIRSTFIYPL